MSTQIVSFAKSRADIAGESLHVLRGGSGQKVLVLHDEWGIRGDEPIWDLLSKQFEIVAPILPGFEDAAVLPTIKTVRDLALLQLALLEAETDEPVAVIGISFGAWIALEMAVMCRHNISRLVLVGPVGLRFGTPEVRNFADLFALNDDQLAETLYLNTDVARIAHKDTPEDETLAWVHNREATALYGWEPYLHTPGLQHWSSQLQLPVTVLHGREDHFVMQNYYRQFVESFSTGSLIEIPDSGHFPHIEAPQQTFEAIERLLA